MHLQCTHNAPTMQLQCNYNATSMQLQCNYNAIAMQLQIVTYNAGNTLDKMDSEALNCYSSTVWLNVWVCTFYNKYKEYSGAKTQIKLRST